METTNTANGAVAQIDRGDAVERLERQMRRMRANYETSLQELHAQIASLHQQHHDKIAQQLYKIPKTTAQAHTQTQTPPQRAPDRPRDSDASAGLYRHHLRQLAAQLARLAHENAQLREKLRAVNETQPETLAAPQPQPQPPAAPRPHGSRARRLLRFALLRVSAVDTRAPTAVSLPALDGSANRGAIAAEP